MSARFRCSDPLAGDFEFEDVESVLDGLEAALVSPDTPLFDTVRQSWQPVAAHAEIRAAWDARLRYRPPGAVGLTLPALPPERSLAEDELARRREAFALVRSGRAAVDSAADQTHPDGRPRMAIAGTIWIMVLLLLLAWGVIAFAEHLTGLAARAAGLDGPPPSP